jgi:hypothetical protein
VILEAVNAAPRPLPSQSPCEGEAGARRRPASHGERALRRLRADRTRETRRDERGLRIADAWVLGLGAGSADAPAMAVRVLNGVTSL